MDFENSLWDMSEVLLASNRVASSKVEQAGFEFKHPTLDEAMASLFDH